MSPNVEAARLRTKKFLFSRAVIRAGTACSPILAKAEAVFLRTDEFSSSKALTKDETAN